MPHSKAMKKNLIRIGKNVEKAIKNQGYSSIYDFWINSPNPLPKSTLHHIAAGKSDPRISTLISLSESLKVSLVDLIKTK